MRDRYVGEGTTVIGEKVDSELCLEGQARVYWVKKDGIKLIIPGKVSNICKGTKCETPVTFGELYVKLFCIAAA